MLAHDEVCVMCGNPLTEYDSMVCTQCKKNGGPNTPKIPTSETSPIKNIHIENSYNTWSPTMMYGKILVECYQKYGSVVASKVLNRSMRGMYIEWYIHNIGYWLTLPFIKKDNIKALNERFKHVDLEEHPPKNISTKNK